MDLSLFLRKFLRGDHWSCECLKELIKVALKARMLRTDINLKKHRGHEVSTTEKEYDLARKEYERLLKTFRDKCRLHGVEVPPFSLDDLCNSVDKLYTGP